METFPDSKQIIEQQIMFAITDDDIKPENLPSTPFKLVLSSYMERTARISALGR